MGFSTALLLFPRMACPSDCTLNLDYCQQRVPTSLKLSIIRNPFGFHFLDITLPQFGKKKQKSDTYDIPRKKEGLQYLIFSMFRPKERDKEKVSTFLFWPRDTPKIIKTYYSIFFCVLRQEAKCTEESFSRKHDMPMPSIQTIHFCFRFYEIMGPNK